VRLLARFACRDRAAASRAEAAVKRLDPARKRALGQMPGDTDLAAWLALADESART
jgi:hypothetical protein